MNRIFMFICLVVGMGQVFAAWDGESKTKPSMDGGVCIISNEAELVWYATASGENDYTKCNAKLTADLDLGKHLWIPIAAGTGEQKYSKVFDGNGHIIKNLYVNGNDLAAIDQKYAQNLGFVGVLGAGTIKNLTLENVDIQASTNAGDILVGKTDQQISVGAFVGWMNEAGSNRVETCMASGSIKTTGNGQGVGGIVGNAKKGTILNCLSFVDIQASGSEAYVGGIIGIIKIEVSVLYSVYAGPGVKTGLDGAVGAIAGYVSSTPSLGTLTVKNAFYEDGSLDGVGKVDDGCDVADGTKKVEFSNTDDVVSLLNDEENESKPWFVGKTKLLLNGYGPDGYRIVFDANGGAFTDDKTIRSLILQAGQKILASEIDKPSLENKFFAGWAFTKDAAKPATDLGSVSAPDTLFAVWTPVYKVTFDVTVPGEETVEKVIEVAEGDAITIDELGELSTEYCKTRDEDDQTICKTYSYIAGWASSPDASEDDIVDLNTVPVSEGLELYAVWKDTDVETYTITFNANQHGQSVESFVHVESGENTIAEPTNPVADDGYEFVDWYTDEAGTEKYDFTKPVTESDILYAKWELKDYKITYVLDGATNNAENPSSYTIESKTILLADPTPAEGYDFEGWFYDAEFTQKTTQIVSGSSGDKTLYAKCVKKAYKVTYLADNNSYGSVSDQVKVYGIPLKFEDGGHFSRVGYEQIGWSDEADGAKVYDLGAEYEDNNPIILYPAWEKNANQIKYVLDGGVNNSDNVDSYSEQKLEEGKVINLKYPIKCGYKFGGWYDNDKFTGSALTQIKKGSTGDLTLYAKWVKFSELDDFGAVKIYKVYKDSSDKSGVKCAVMENGTKAKVTIGKNTAVGYVTFDRTFPVNRNADDKMFSTVVLPFSIAKSKVDGAEFYEFKGVATTEENEKQVQISSLSSDEIVAYKPYIIRTTKAKLTFNIGENETVTLNTIKKNNSVSKDGLWELRSSNAYKQWTANDPELGFAYGYAAKAAKNLSVGEFARNAAGAFIYPFRAYLLYTPKAKAASQYASNFLAKSATSNQASIDGFALPETMEVVIVEGNNETVDQTPAFNMLKVPGQVKFRNGWFDMMGRKLNGRPTAKGIYYYNGKRIRIY